QSLTLRLAGSARIAPSRRSPPAHRPADRAQLPGSGVGSVGGGGDGRPGSTGGGLGWVAGLSAAPPGAPGVAPGDRAGSSTPGEAAGLSFCGRPSAWPSAGVSRCSHPATTHKVLITNKVSAFLII